MSDFVYDNTSLPSGKVDVPGRNAGVPANQKLTAAEYAVLAQAIEDLRSAVLSGKYHGLADYLTASLAQPNTLVMRSHGGALEISQGGDPFRGVPGVFNVKAYGARGDGTTNDSAAFASAIAAMATNCVLHIPPGKYRLDTELHVVKTIIIEGSGNSIAGSVGDSNGAGPSTVLEFGPGVNGVIFDSVQSSPANPTTFSQGAVLRHLTVQSADRYNAAVCHGIIMRNTAYIHDVAVLNFPGDGFHIVASTDGNNVDGNTAWAPSTHYRVGDWVYASGTLPSAHRYVCVQAGTSASSGTGPSGEAYRITDGTAVWKSPAAEGQPYASMGNADNWQVTGRCRSYGHRQNGMYIEGDVANIGLSIGLDVGVNQMWGIWDNSFLGCVHLAPHAATNSYASPGPGGVGYAYGAYKNCTVFGGYTELDQGPTEGGVAFAGLMATGFKQGSNASWIQPASAGGSGAEMHMPSTRFDAGTYGSLGIGPAAYIGSNYQGNGIVEQFVDADGVNGAALILRDRKLVWSTPAQLSDYQAWGQTLNGGQVGGVISVSDRITELSNLRTPAPLSLWSSAERGVLLNGARLLPLARAPSASDSGPFAVAGSTPGQGYFWDWEVGDIVPNGRASPGAPAGWVCTTAGTGGTYNYEDPTSHVVCTFTANGTTTLTTNVAERMLSAGNRIVINGVTTKVVTPGNNSTTVVVADAIPAGSGLVPVYVTPVFKPYGVIAGETADSTGLPGAATQNTYSGRVAIAAGASSVVVTNSRITSTSKVFAVLQTVDATLTQVLSVVPASGSFTVHGNANATAATNIAWRLEE